MYVFHSIAKYMCIYIYIYYHFIYIYIYIYIYYGQLPCNLTMAPLSTTLTSHDHCWCPAILQPLRRGCRALCGGTEGDLNDWWTDGLERQTWGYEKAILIWNIKGRIIHTLVHNIIYVPHNMSVSILFVCTATHVPWRGMYTHTLWYNIHTTYTLYAWYVYLPPDPHREWSQVLTMARAWRHPPLMPEAEAPPTATIATFFPGISGGTYMDIYIYINI